MLDLRRLDGQGSGEVDALPLQAKLGSEATVAKEEAAEDEYDPLRDGPLRYLGYANEVG